MIKIVPLSQIAPVEIEALLDAAFGEDRKGRTAYKLRAGTDAIPALSFAAIKDDGLIGSLQSWPVLVGDAPLTLVGPVAVHPAHQRIGIGKLLMDALIAAAGKSPMMMIGDPEYYGRFYDFTAEVTSEWQVPGPVERHRLLARNVNAGLAGAVAPRVKAG